MGRLREVGDTASTRRSEAVFTGARWSGPLFFGLKRRAEKIAHG
jgi:hypothetical protein